MSASTEKILRTCLLIGLVLWGGYTFLSYWAVGYHQAVLLPQDVTNGIHNACPDSGALCAGVRSILPSITYFVSRLGFYGWYIGLSILLYLAWLFKGYLRTQKPVIELRLSPLKMILLFVLSVWVLFTAISFGDNNGQPYRQVYKPSAQTFQGATPATLQTLLQDYQLMEQRGCLTPVQGAPVELGVANISVTCMQESFITRVLSQMLVLLVYLLAMLTLGRFLILRALRLNMRDIKLEAIFSVAVGACALIVMLWLFAIAALYTQLAGWLILGGILAVLWRHTWYWLRVCYERTWTQEESAWSGTVILAWLLLSYLAFNYLTVIRPFPIGWDDLGVYLNDPRLLVSYGAVIPRMPTFQWGYVTSLGFLLFGYDSFFAATNSMLINWMAGALALFSVYVFANRYLGRLGGILATLLYYTMPLVGHFSFADMKVDNAVFMAGALGMFAAFCGLFPAHDGSEASQEGNETPRSELLRWMILSGVLLGFGFAMKPTTVMVVMATAAVLFGAFWGPFGFIGFASLAWALFIEQGTFNVKDVSTHVYGVADALNGPLLLGIFLAIGIGGIVYAYYKKPSALRITATMLGTLVLACVVTIIPWLTRNNVLRHSPRPELAFDVPNTYSPNFVMDKQGAPPGTKNVRALPPDLALDMTIPQCSGSTSKKEELDRYWGYGSGWSHYLGLPWRSVMNADSFGYYVTMMPALLLFPLLLLVPAFWKRTNKWLLWLFFATLFIVVQWMFFANGVPWYGIGMFLGLAIGLSALYVFAQNKSARIIVGVLLGISLFSNLSHRFWQAETQRNLYTYPIGAVSAEAMQERTIPHYNDIRDSVLLRNNTIPDAPYTYRIGTFIPYFIPRNLEVLPVGDHQLDMFSCLNAEKKPAITLKRLKALGFNGIIFDTNTDTIEKDPNGTLHKKVREFVDFVNTQGLGMQIVVNDTGGGIAYILLP